MKTITLLEHESIQILDKSTAGLEGRTVTNRQAAELLALDRGRTRGAKRAIFSWGYKKLTATQFVGVVQTSTVCLEILPKIHDNTEDNFQQKCRENLLYLLTLSGLVPFTLRDLAGVSTSSSSLLEVIFRFFAENLHLQLRQGAHRSYVAKEENLLAVKGRIDIAKQIRDNAVHKERIFCRYDEMCEDTQVNRIFHWSARLILKNSRSSRTKLLLKECLTMLQEVTLSSIFRQTFDDARAENPDIRYFPLIELSQLFFDSQASQLRSGSANLPAIVFDMNVIFERAVANLCTKAINLDRPDLIVTAQGQKQATYLLTSQGRNQVLLKPDIIVRSRAELSSVLCVIDTKWKVPAKEEGKRWTPKVGDLYQVFAYTKRFQASKTVLIYPKTKKVLREIDYEVAGTSEFTQSIQVKTIDLSVDLGKARGRASLLQQIRDILREGTVVKPFCGKV